MVGILQMTLRSGVAMGLDRPTLLAAAGLTETDLVDRDRHVPAHHQGHLATFIVRQNPEVNISLVLFEQIHLATAGLLGYALSHCPTLREAVQTFCRYQGMLTNMARWHFDNDAGIVHVVSLMGGPSSETMLLLIVRLGREITGVKWCPTRLRVQHAALGDPEEYRPKLGFDITFQGETNVLEIPQATLDLPVVNSRPSLVPGITQLISLVQPTPPSDALLERLRVELERRLPQGTTQRAAYARALAVSERTLNRRLRAAGTSFRAELELSRRLLTEAYLSRPEVPIYEIAFLLGYADPSTLHQASRRWFGCSPQAWRRQILSEGRSPRAHREP